MVKQIGQAGLGAEKLAKKIIKGKGEESLEKQEASEKAARDAAAEAAAVKAKDEEVLARALLETDKPNIKKETPEEEEKRNDLAEWMLQYTKKDDIKMRKFLNRAAGGLPPLSEDELDAFKFLKETLSNLKGQELSFDFNDDTGNFAQFLKLYNSSQKPDLSFAKDMNTKEDQELADYDFSTKQGLEEVFDEIENYAPLDKESQDYFLFKKLQTGEERITMHAIGYLKHLLSRIDKQKKETQEEKMSDFDQALDSQKGFRKFANKYLTAEDKKVLEGEKWHSVIDRLNNEGKVEASHALFIYKNNQTERLGSQMKELLKKNCEAYLPIEKVLINKGYKVTNLNIPGRFSGKLGLQVTLLREVQGGDIADTVFLKFEGGNEYSGEIAASPVSEKYGLIETADSMVIKELVNSEGKNRMTAEELLKVIKGKEFNQATNSIKDSDSLKKYR